MKPTHIAALFVILNLCWAIPPRAMAQLPPLPGSLVVTITSPSSESTVASTITVSASVSAVGVLVAGVQFQLDGGNLGAEDTSAPYAISWNTASTNNGSHTLVAVARDALGLRFVSDPVTITVSNAPPPPPPQDTTPPAVAITTPTPGSTVSGTITVSADASDNVGVAGVQFKLDGANLGAEDTTAPYAISWDTTTTSDGSHTLTAVGRDAAGNQATSDSVTFTVSNAAPPPPPTVTRFEETDPSVTYTDGWAQGSTARSWSGGTAAVSTTAGAQATFNFTGTAVRWIGFRGPQTGIARVFLDGALAAEVDTFSTSEEVGAVLFEAMGLTAGSHTLTIEVTGTSNPASSNSIIVVDAFDVASSPPPPATVTRVQETDASITYTDGWAQGNTARAWSGGTAAVSTTAGSRATLTFTGTSVSWISFRGPQAGIARVFLDGALAAEVDAFSASEEVEAVLFKATGLTAGTHTLAIEVTGLKNPDSSNTFIVVDAFDVTS